MDRYAPKQDMYDHNRFVGMLLSDDGQWYRHDQVHATITALEQQVADLTKERDAAREWNGFVTNETIKVLIAERDTLQTALDAERAKVKGLENAVTISEQLVESWQETATRLQDDYDALKAQLAVAQATQDEMWTRKGYLEVQLAQLTEELANERTAYKKLSEQWNKSDLELTTLRTLVGALPRCDGNIEIAPFGGYYGVTWYPGNGSCVTLGRFRSCEEANAYKALLTYCATLDVAPGVEE